MSLTSQIDVDGRLNRILDFLKKSELPEKTGILFQKFITSEKIVFNYKTWQRDISELGQRGLISGNLVRGGAFGTTTIITEVSK
ncbi:hypothetical protein K8R33_02845 [archaeon]|nr:hypothetical protein [archaeon]